MRGAEITGDQTLGILLGWVLIDLDRFIRMAWLSGHITQADVVDDSFEAAGSPARTSKPETHRATFESVDWKGAAATSLANTTR